MGKASTKYNGVYITVSGFQATIYFGHNTYNQRQLKLGDSNSEIQAAHMFDMAVLKIDDLVKHAQKNPLTESEQEYLQDVSDYLHACLNFPENVQQSREYKVNTSTIEASAQKLLDLGLQHAKAAPDEVFVNMRIRCRQAVKKPKKKATKRHFS